MQTTTLTSMVPLQLMEPFSAPATKVGTAIAVLLLVIVGWVDVLTGTDASMFFLYLVPVGQAAWFAGKKAGLTIAVLSGVTWYVANSSLFGGESIGQDVYAWNGTVRLGLFVAAAYAITLQRQLRQSLKREEELSRTDYLTGALNKRAFVEVARSEIERSSRFGHPFSVLYLDVDGFKGVNDARGHTEGDQLLKCLVATTASAIRQVDVLARLGGDEFVALLPETAAEAAAVVASRIRDAFATALVGRGWPVTLSIGVVTYITPPVSYEVMLSEVDAQMYSAKKAGKDRISAAVRS